MNLDKTILKFALNKAKSLPSIVAVSVEALLHHSFGERCTKNMVEAVVLTTFVCFAASVAHPEASAPLFPAYVALLFLRLVAHVITIPRRGGNPVHIHSYSSGSSWGIWSRLRVSASVIHCLLEPLLCFAVGVLLSHIDFLLSAWLQVAALALFCKAVMGRFRAHQQMLDALDGRTSARNLNAALQHRLNPRLGAADSPVNATMSPARAPGARSLAEILRNLEPRLRRLIQEDQQVAAPKGTLQRVRVGSRGAAPSTPRQTPARATVRPNRRSPPQGSAEA